MPKKKYYIVFVITLFLTGCMAKAIPSQYDIKIKSKIHELSYCVGDDTKPIEIILDSRRYTELSSTDGIYLSYHILDSLGNEVIHDGLRTNIEKIEARGIGNIPLSFNLPETAGEYILEVDLVEESVTWFSQQGMPSLKIPLYVAISDK